MLDVFFELAGVAEGALLAITGVLGAVVAAAGVAVGALAGAEDASAEAFFLFLLGVDTEGAEVGAALAAAAGALAGAG